MAKNLTQDIEISDAMIRAGVAELQEKMFGQDVDQIVRDIYLMMEIERRHQAIAAASSTSLSR